MADSQFPALSLDNNPWMKYFSPTSNVDLSTKARVASPPVQQSMTAIAAPPPAVVRTQSGKLTRHTSAPNRLNNPAQISSTLDRSSNEGRKGKAEAPSGDSSIASPNSTPANSQPRLVKKPSNTLLQKQKLFKSTQSAPNLTANLREQVATDAAGRSIESEISQQSLYKTELCRSFEETGSCRYGTKCQFAHGKNELRPVIRHPKYKTEICKTWQAHGSCPYGARCRFIHHEEMSPSNSSSSSSSPPAASVVVSSPVPIADPLRTPVAPSSQSSSPAPRLAVFADIIGESTAQ